MNLNPAPNRLAQAILNNDVKATKTILEKSSTEKIINYIDFAETPLTLAIEKENPIIVNLLLDYPNIDVNLANKKGMTPLHLIAKKTTLKKCLDKIIEHPSIDFSIFNAQKNVLHFLVESGQIEYLDKILQKNINIDMSNSSSLFKIAFYNKNMDMVKKLYELSQYYPSIIQLEECNKIDILEQAVDFYHVEAVNFILTLNLKSFNKRKHTAIALAVEHGDLDLIKTLTHSCLGTQKNVSMAIHKCASGSVIHQYLSNFLTILKEKSQLDNVLHSQSDNYQGKKIKI